MAAALAKAKGNQVFPGTEASGLGKRVSMDARTIIEKRLLSRHRGSADAALHLPEIFSAEIFKKTPCAAGLKPRGRDAAKDMFEIGYAPLPATTLNVKLTGAGRLQHETKWRVRQTNHRSSALVIDLGVAHEKQRYADI